MRDLFLFFLIAIPLCAAFKKPQVGLLIWLWISVMNPHRESFGWIRHFPVLDVVAAVTLFSCLINLRYTARSHWMPPLTWLLIFYLWCSLTTMFSVSIELSLVAWIEFSKTLLLCFMMLLYMNKRHWMLAATGVFCLAILHTGFKGGIYTLYSGGGYRIYGPPGTAWGDNNGVSVAMLMVFPLTLAMRHLLKKGVLRLTLLGSGILSFFTLLGTQSRGGLVGLAGQSLMLLYRSNRKLPVIVGLSLLLAIGFTFMPDSWRSRMETITFDIEEMDPSSANRVIQWFYAIDIANERPFFASGFNAFYHRPYYYRFVAHLDDNRAVHSNYFEVIGEQGWIGFFFYCMLWLTFILSSEKYAQLALSREDLAWAGALLRALQVSFAGYAFNGLTVNMAYLDLPYYLLVFSVLLMSHVSEQVAQRELSKTSKSWPRRVSV